MYVEFTEDERLETLMGCHTRAFAYFGGVTQTCLYDNMKTVVAGHDENGEVIWNERFSRFSGHYGFILRRCQPYRPRTKGKVENGVGYVRKNFWPRIRTFTGLQDLNVQVLHWLDTVANRRLHGTTFRVPAEMLQGRRITAGDGYIVCLRGPIPPESIRRLLLFNEVLEADKLLDWWYPLAKKDSTEGHLVVGWLCKLKKVADPDGITPSDRFSKAIDW